MFEFKILGISEASVEIEHRNWPTRIISVVSRYMPVEHRGPHHLIVRMEDVHTEDGDDYPTHAMLDEILDFTKDLKDEDRVLIHCFAGQSRSSATALAVLMQHGLSFEDAHRAVIENRSFALPNQLIVKLLDERHNLGGKFIYMNNHYVSGKLREKAITAVEDTKAAGVSDGQVEAMRKIMDMFR